MYCKACREHVPALLCTTKLAQSAIPVLLCTTELAQSTSQYYFVLQSLYKVIPITTLYCKACTEHVPALLCTTKLPQSTSPSYFALQSFHRALSSVTLYCKACTKHVPALLCTTKLAQSAIPVLLCTTELAQSTSQYYFALQSLRKTKVLHTHPWRQATLTQPLLCDLQILSCKREQNYAHWLQKLQLQNRIWTPEQKKDFEALSKRIFIRKASSSKNEKIC